MIFWIATSYVGGALFVASHARRRRPEGTAPARPSCCSGAVVVVVVGSLLGEWAGIDNLLGELWFWFGNQGWEYLELGRFWQILLAAGLALLVLAGVARGRARRAATPSCGPSSSSS